MSIKSLENCEVVSDGLERGGGVSSWNCGIVVRRYWGKCGRSFDDKYF